MNRQFTAVIQREDDMYVALCPELDVASQGDTVQEARENLREAIELFLQEADPQEIQQRMHDEQYVTSVEGDI
jgi:predicted RNase H-like HicB family nuclease